MGSNGYIAPRSKILWHVGRLQAIRLGQRMPPINVEIDLSNRCNLGCEWCHFAYTHTRGPLAKGPKLADAVPGGDLMELDLAKRIIRQLSRAGVQSIVWTGGGEPTIYPNFDEIVLYAANQTNPLSQGIYTNGALISAERAALLKANMTWVNVSLDAATATDYRLAKRVDAFDKVCANTEVLAKAPGKAVLGVSFLITKQNSWQMNAMVKLGRRLGADYIYLRPTILYDLEGPGELAEDPRWIDFILDDLAVYEDDEDVVVDPERFKLYRDWQGHGYDTCWWSAVQTVITPNGKMWTCVNKREHAGALLGDLSKEDFSVVWGRNTVADVDADCRVMCRGHLGNLTMDRVMRKPPHAEFI